MNFERLRALLLEQAIRGELVEQQARDSAVLVVDGVLPKESYPFEIPDHWKWYPLGKIVEYGKGTQIGSGEISETTWVLDLEDIEKGTGCLLNKKRGTPTTSNKTKFCKGDVLYGKLRPYLNKVLVADEDGVCTTEIVPIRVVTAKLPLLAEYLQSYLMSPFFLDYANKISYGVKMPRLGTKDAKAALIPVPPIEEQTRIVTKLDEAFAEIDRAEKAYGELQTLAGVLRGQLLQEAIQGKLVPQLAEEGVVEQIGVAPEEVPFKIPESWSWIRVEELAVKRRTIDPSTLTNDEIELWSIPAFDAGVAEKVSPGDIGSSKKVVQVGDVLLAKIVPHIKRVWVVSESANSLMKLASTEWLVYASELFLPEFMGLLFRAPYFRTKMMESVSGMGSLKRANPRILAKVWLPVPPIAEQARIVTKVEELLKQVDALST
jgi:type I restriction enzyme S subunit